MKTSANIKEIENLIEEKLFKGEITALDLVQLFERLNPYTSLKTIPQYAKDNNISYNGAKKCRDVVKLFGVKFIMDNY